MKLILVANWKNHPSSLREASKNLQGLSRQASSFKKLSTFIAPPVAFFETVSKKVRRFGHLASQDLSPLPIMKSFGVRLAILGHSDRRKVGETNAEVAEKAKLALKEGMIPLICVGEEVHDVEGNYFEFLSEQIKASLSGIKNKSDGAKIILAYEPIWAIGKKAKDALEPRELSQVVIFIKKVLTEIFGRKVADKIAILYGGSVEPENTQVLIKATGIRGFLVGHASLEPKHFASIAKSMIK